MGARVNDMDKSTAEVLAVGAARSSAAPARNPAPNLEARVASLAAALRKARIEGAERSSVIADLRGAEIARLDLLREALEPVLAQIPRDCDLFDVAISPGERPRLFIDAIGFVEMGRDRRAYRFLQDTRHGRVTIGETEDLEDMIEAVTAYIAHRLIEREKALAVDFASGGSARASAAQAMEKSAVAPPASARLSAALSKAYLLLLEFAAAGAFISLAVAVGLHVYRTYLAQ